MLSPGDPLLIASIATVPGAAAGLLTTFAGWAPGFECVQQVEGDGPRPGSALDISGALRETPT